VRVRAYEREFEVRAPLESFSAEGISS